MADMTSTFFVVPAAEEFYVEFRSDYSLSRKCRRYFGAFHLAAALLTFGFFWCVGLACGRLQVDRKSGLVWVPMTVTACSRRCRRPFQWAVTP